MRQRLIIVAHTDRGEAIRLISAAISEGRPTRRFWESEAPEARTECRGPDFLVPTFFLGGEEVSSDTFVFFSAVNSGGEVVLDSVALSGVGSVAAMGPDGTIYLAGFVSAGFSGSTATAVQTSFGSGDPGLGAARVEPGPTSRPFISSIENSASLNAGSRSWPGWRPAKLSPCVEEA